VFGAVALAVLAFRFVATHGGHSALNRPSQPQTGQVTTTTSAAPPAPTAPVNVPDEATPDLPKAADDSTGTPSPTTSTVVAAVAPAELPSAPFGEEIQPPPSPPPSHVPVKSVKPEAPFK
jgi:hypothetical protein